MRMAFYLFALFASLMNAVWDIAHWYRGNPAGGMVWLYAVVLSVLIAFNCFDRLMTKEDHR